MNHQSIKKQNAAIKAELAKIAEGEKGKNALIEQYRLQAQAIIEQMRLDKEQ